MKTPNHDILLQLFKKYPFNSNNLNRVICGAKHCAVELKNGNIGICSTLGVSVKNELSNLANPDFIKIDHRILINAWVNACANYAQPVNGEGDIFDVVDFHSYKNIVMIGFFGSLSNKFKESGIQITIFDLDPTDKPVAPIETQHQFLSNADAVILTATSISNLTFGELIQNTSDFADIFILGPSTPLDSLLLNYSKIKALFGSRIFPFNSNCIDFIHAGGGTKAILPFMKKVYIYKK